MIQWQAQPQQRNQDTWAAAAAIEAQETAAKQQVEKGVNILGLHI